MKKLLLLSVFALGTAVAANAQTPDPKTTDVKTKSCCASKAEKAQCAEMKAASQADTEKSASAPDKATAEKAAPKTACCASKASGEASSCKGKKTATAAKD